MEEFRTIRDFETYAVSNEGRIMNEHTGRLMRLQYNQRGFVIVRLRQGTEAYTRSVSTLVAKEFLPRPDQPSFDSVIHLDFMRSNNHENNLMWRPRWFAFNYRIQRNYPNRGIPHPIMDLSDGRVFRDSWHAATTFGLIALDIAQSIHDGGPVWPTGQRFALL